VFLCSLFFIRTPVKEFSVHPDPAWFHLKSLTQNFCKDSMNFGECHPPIIENNWDFIIMQRITINRVFNLELLEIDKSK
jgi:hypothetical protein